MFLINNPQWLLAESNEKIESLYDQFEAFGGAIGQDHVSVWFWSTNRIRLNGPNFWLDEETDIDTSKGLHAPWFVSLNRAVDVARSAKFCEKLKLPPSGGPYLFVTNEYPGEGLIGEPSTFLPTPLKIYYTVSLNNKSSDEIMQLLTRLADKITSDRLSELDSSSGGWWIAWQRAFEGIRGFLSARQMTVTIKTPLGEIKIG